MIGFLSLGIGVWIWGIPWGLCALFLGFPFDIWLWFHRHPFFSGESKEETRFYLLAYSLLLKMVSAGGGLAANQFEYLEFILNYANLRRLSVPEIEKVRKELLSLSRKGVTFHELLRALSQSGFSQDKIDWLWMHASRIVNLKKGHSAETALFFKQFKEAFKIQEEGQKIAEVHLLDSYGILGCSAHSSNEEIKTNFRLLAKRYHPDAQSSLISEQEMARITEQFLTIFEAYSQVRKERNF